MPSLLLVAWVYRNVQVHNTVSGLKAVKRKEELQRKIEHHVLLGETGLAEQDRYVLKIWTSHWEEINNIGFWPYTQ